MDLNSAEQVEILDDYDKRDASHLNVQFRGAVWNSQSPFPRWIDTLPGS